MTIDTGPSRGHIRADGAEGVGVSPVTGSMRLDPLAISTRSARRFMGRALGDAEVEPDVCEAVVLLTSEVVTNAVLHARSPIELAVAIGSHAVRVQVSDGLPGLRRGTDPSRSGGKGLVLVAAIASHWGISAREGAAGKSVWFEVARPPSPQAAGRRFA